MTWQEERRADRQAEARLALEREQLHREQDREDHREHIENARKEREDRARRAREARTDRLNRARHRRAQIRAWAAAHAVDLLIYPLALVSAILAIPAMADYGHKTYGDATGYVLPALSELGMWCFAVAVQVVRHRHPQRPVWALQFGTWLFAGVAATLNGLHGAEKGVDTAVVMAVASIAGVIAHQLIVAGRRRTVEERAEHRHARRVRRKTNRVRRAALRSAVGEVDPDGAVRLVYKPGRYTLKTLDRGLDPAIVPGLPVDPETADWDAALAALGTRAPVVEEPQDRPSIEAIDSIDSSSIATLDRPDDQPESDDPPKQGRGRSFGELVAEFEDAIEESRLDPTKAESIRLALKCSPVNARKLRGYYAASKRRKGGRK